MVLFGVHFHAVPQVIIAYQVSLAGGVGGGGRERESLLWQKPFRHSYHQSPPHLCALQSY